MVPNLIFDPILRKSPPDGPFNGTLSLKYPTSQIASDMEFRFDGKQNVYHGRTFILSCLGIYDLLMERRGLDFEFGSMYNGRQTCRINLKGLIYLLESCSCLNCHFN